MEVKCPKCRFRYDTPVGAGITEIACVCPRCGTPFTHTISEENLAAADAASLPQPDAAAVGSPAATGAAASTSTEAVPASAGAAAPLPQLDAQEEGKPQWIKHTIPAENQPQKKRRGCLRNCLIVFLIAFVALVFAVRNCFGDRSYKQAMLEQGINQSLDEFGDGSVVRDADEFVEIHPEPIPEWLEGTWRVETEYGVITITIHGNKIAEESGGEISRGTFYYKEGRLFCDFGDGELAVRRLNMKRKCIDAGDGMLMEKQ